MEFFKTKPPQPNVSKVNCYMNEVLWNCEVNNLLHSQPNAYV